MHLCCFPQTEFDQRPEWGATFMSLAEHCQSVLCCRVTPAQKAEIVTLVRKHTSSVTMSIGDGANDVNMIKSKGLFVVKINQCALIICVHVLTFASFLFPQHQRLMLVWVWQEWREVRRCRMQTLHWPSSGFCSGCFLSMAAGPTAAFPSSCAISCLRPAVLPLCIYGLVSSMASVLRLDKNRY